MKNLFLFIILVFFAFDSSAQCDRQRDSLALVALYNSTDGPNWVSSWDLSEALNYWHGVTLNSSGCVEKIELSFNSLEGMIPEEIGNLEELVHLDLNTNYISGELIQEIGLLENLTYVDLSWNELEGMIPPEFGRLKKLETLNLEVQSLESLLPQEFSELTSLKYFDISDNDFSGPFPRELLELDSIIEIDLSGNDFLSGSIPEELSSLPYLSTLLIDQNSFSGCFPDFVCSLDEFNASENPELPWEGDHTQLCAFSMDQIGAPCNDPAISEKNEQINEDCECVPVTNNGESITTNFSFYPNPFLRSLFIEMPVARPVTLKVFDVSGSLVYEKSLTNGRNLITLEQLPSGTYRFSIGDYFNETVVKR